MVVNQRPLRVDSYPHINMAPLPRIIPPGSMKIEGRQASFFRVKILRRIDNAAKKILFSCLGTRVDYA